MKLLQKILSHGLLIAFTAAAIFLYIDRDEVFPHWFGEDRVPIAERPAAESTPQDVHSVQSTEPDLADQEVGSEPQIETAGTGEPVELPPVAKQDEPEASLEEAHPQPAEVQALPPLAKEPDLAGQEVGSEPQIETAGTGEPVELPPVAKQDEAETSPEEAHPQPAEVEALPPLAEAPEAQPETPSAVQGGATDLPPMGQPSDATAEDVQSAGMTPPPVKTVQDQEAQEVPTQADATDQPGQADAESRSAAAPAASGVATTELPPSASAAESSDQEAAVVTAPPEVQAGASAPSQPGDTGGAATAAGGEQPSNLEYRSQATDKAAANWASPEEPEQAGYRPLPQTPDKAVGWVSTAPSDSDHSASVSEPPQYRPESPSAATAPPPQVGAQPAAAAPAAQQTDQEYAQQTDQEYEDRLSDARQHFWAQDLQTAVSIYQGLTQDYPTHADAWGELGNVNFRLGQWQAAAQAYATAVELLADQGENERAGHLLQILYGLDAERAGQLEGRLK